MTLCKARHNQMFAISPCKYSNTLSTNDLAGGIALILLTYLDSISQMFQQGI